MSYTLQAENFKSRIYTDIDVSSIFFHKAASPTLSWCVLASLRWLQ